MTWFLERRKERPVALNMTQHAAFSWTAGLAVVAIGPWLAVLQSARCSPRAGLWPCYATN